MKFFVVLIFSLVISLSVFAQDEAVLKKQATQVANATGSADFQTIIDHTYPAIVQASGGKEKMMEGVKASFGLMKKQGVTFTGASIGQPGKFYHAAGETYAIVPDVVKLHFNNGTITNNGYLLAISKDGGKFWYFLDVNSLNYQAIPRLVPNAVKVMKLPEPIKPTFTPDKK